MPASSTFSSDPEHLLSARAQPTIQSIHLDVARKGPGLVHLPTGASALPSSSIPRARAPPRLQRPALPPENLPTPLPCSSSSLSSPSLYFPLTLSSPPTGNRAPMALPYESIVRRPPQARAPPDLLVCSPSPPVLLRSALELAPPSSAFSPSARTKTMTAASTAAASPLEREERAPPLLYASSQPQEPVPVR